MKLSKFAYWNSTAGVFSLYKGSVILPLNMKEVPTSSFANFQGSVTLPEGIEKIGTDVFRNATIPNLDFSNCLNLESLGVGAFNNLTLTIKNELDFRPNLKLSKFAYWNSTAGVFSLYKGSVILPLNMKEVPTSSFANFQGSVTLPEGIEKIGIDAFNSCRPSSEIILPSSVTIFSDRAFMGFVSNRLDLTKVSNLTTIGTDVFRNATIPNLDFSNCLNLESLGVGAFNNLTLTVKNELDFSPNLKLSKFAYWNSTAGVFSLYKGHVILPTAMKELPTSSFANFQGSVTLPSGLKTIGNYAFQNSSIKEIDLPASVTTIGANAFYNCTALQKITSWNATPPALGTNVFYGVNKTTCGLFVPAGGIPLYQAAAQWKDFLIGTYTFDMRLADTNLYRVSNDEPFTIKMPAYMALNVNLGLYTLNGIFLESINKSNDRGLVTCQISNNISEGSYLIQPYILEGDEKKIVSRISGSHNIDRLPITVENDWWSTRSLRSAAATADISSHLLFKTGASDLLEVTPNQNFNVLVRYKNATTAIKIGLYDALSGTMVADVTESVTGNNYTCKVPASVPPGEYNLIPYELALGKPVFVERGEDVSYLIDRLPLSVVATNTTKSLVTDETIDQVNVSVYPNPATDVIHVSGGNIEQLFIYDMSGRRVLTSNGSTSLQIGDLPKGTYLLTVKTADGESTHKIIKK